MVALRTGWTPDVLAEMPARFRAATHWALFAEALSGPEGLPSTDIPAGAPAQVRMAALKQNAAILPLRKILYPEDDGV